MLPVVSSQSSSKEKMEEEESWSLTNGGLVYHEVQESSKKKLCALHCLNTLLQGPFFSVKDLSVIASDLRGPTSFTGDDNDDGPTRDFLAQDGNFSIQVIKKALTFWDLQAVPLNPLEALKHDPENENAFICQSHDHWFCIRKVNGEWYNFNSLYAAPMPLSKFYLSVFIDTLKTSAWSVFRVVGYFPRDCPGTDPNGFGQWLTPEDAKKLSDELDGTKTAPPPHDNDYNLNAAMAASLMEYVEAATVKCDPYADTEVPYDTDDDDDDDDDAVDADGDAVDGDAVDADADGDECTLAGIAAVRSREETKDCTDDDSVNAAVQKTENAMDQ